jgi:hypothetical protein
MFIPIECVTISRARRFDSRLVSRIAWTSLVAVSLIAPLLFMDSGNLGQQLERLWPFGAAVTAMGALYASYALLRFFRRNPTVRFDAEVYGGFVRIECWNGPDNKRALDSLVSRLLKLQDHLEDLVPYPVEMSYQMYIMRSFRVSVVRAAIVTLLLLVLCVIAADWLQTPYLWYLLVLPWVVYLGRYGLDWVRLRLQPRLFSEAVCAYEDEDLALAQRLLAALQGENPDYVPGLILHAQVCTLRGEFASAFSLCDRVERYIPELAETLRDEILGIERLQRRMDEEV